MTDLPEHPDPEGMLEEEFADLLGEMEDAVRAGIPGAAALLDRTAKGSLEHQELLQDLMRGSTTAYPVETSLAILRELGGWTPYNETTKDVVSMGDFLCDIDINEEKWPCTIFGAIATPFDDDPLLACIVGYLRNMSERACLLHMHPIFQMQADREGYVSRFVLFGGWLIDADTCRPFCIEPGGTDGLPEQTKFFRTPRISRGFFRDRGHDGEKLSILIDTQIAINKSVTEERKEHAGDLAKSGAAPSLDRSDYTLATGRDDWSFFMDRAAADRAEELQGLMADIDNLEEGSTG